MADQGGRHAVTVCTAAKGGMRAVVEGYRASGVFDQWGVEWLAPHGEGTLGFRLRVAVRAYLRFLGLLFSRSVSLVHCHAAMRGSFWRKSVFALTARAFAVPVVFHMHGSETARFIDSQPRWVRGLISRILSSMSSVVVLSDSWQRYISSVAPSARVEVLPNYVRPPATVPCRDVPVAQAITFLFLGAVGQRKGIYPLLEAFALALAQGGAPLRLVVGGDGELEQARAVAAQLGIEQQVHFAGWVSGPDKDRWLAEADVYILPSFNEGLPVSLLEAMSWGLPVISTTVGGIPELVRHGMDGYLVAAGDVPDLALRIATLGRSAALRAEHGAAGRDRVRALYSEEVVVPRLHALYARLVKTESK